MKRLLKIHILAVLILLSLPTVARAEGGCSGLGCWLGWDLKTVERTEITQEAETDRTELKEDGATDRARIEAEAETARLNEQRRIESERATEIERINREADKSIAESAANATVAQADKDKYVAYVENWRQSQVELARFEADKAMKALQMQSDQAIQALQGATDIGLKSLTEAGETKRWALTTDLIWSVVLIVGLIFLGYYFLKKQSEPQPFSVLPGSQRPQLPPGYRAQLPGRRQNVDQEIERYDYIEQ